MVLRAHVTMIFTWADQSSVRVKKTPRYLSREDGISVAGKGSRMGMDISCIPNLEGARRRRRKYMISVLSISAERPKSFNQKRTS